MGAFKIIFAFAVGALWLNPLAAADLYKYRDANGRWVMTDKKPAHEEFEQKPLLFTQERTKVAVVNRGSQERPVLFAVNHLHGPVEVTIEFLEQDNVRLSQQGPLQWLIDGPGDVFLLQLQPENPARGWRYQWRHGYTIGPPIDEAFAMPVVGLPIAGGPFVISQGFMGEASHNSHPQSYHAVDIAVPPGTPIVAVREGRVMDVERDFTRSGWQQEYANEANFVRVLHKDGSMAVYAHLRANGIEVVAGQAVKAGQLLGYSGSTGYSSGPHLHFAIQVNRAQTLQSIPFQFAGVGRVPQSGDFVQQAAAASN